MRPRAIIVRIIVILLAVLIGAWWSGYIVGLIVRGYHTWARW
jgi:hypothetical protein